MSLPFEKLEAEYLERKHQIEMVEAALAEAKQDEIEAQERQQKLEAQLEELRKGKVSVSTPKTPRKKQKTLADYCYRIIRQYQKPMHRSELAKHAVARGFKTTSNLHILAHSVASVASKDKRFIGLGKGMYDIAKAESDQTE